MPWFPVLGPDTILPWITTSVIISNFRKNFKLDSLLAQTEAKHRKENTKCRYVMMSDMSNSFTLLRFNAILYGNFYPTPKCTIPYYDCI